MPLPSGEMGQGGAPKRKRNTQANSISKGGGSGFQFDFSSLTGGDLPALDPAAIANYYGQIQTMQAQLANTLAGLRQQRVGLRGEAGVARQDVKAEGRAAMTETVNTGLERGMSGGSADLAGRAGVRADVAGGIADVNRSLYNQLAESRMQGTAAALGFDQASQQLEMSAIAQRMSLAQQQEANQIAIRTAKMQASATAQSTAAQMAMAQKQLRIERQTAKGMKAQANDPTAIWAQFGLTPPGAPTRSAFPGRVSSTGEFRY